MKSAVKVYRICLHSDKELVSYETFLWVTCF